MPQIKYRGTTLEETIGVRNEDYALNSPIWIVTTVSHGHTRTLPLIWDEMHAIYESVTDGTLDHPFEVVMVHDQFGQLQWLWAQDE